MPGGAGFALAHQKGGGVLTQVITPSRLSWSSISTYSECGVRWLLERGYKLPTATWYATLAGSAIHEITEIRDRLELLGYTPEEQVLCSPTFEDEFAPLVQKALDEGRAIRPSGYKRESLSETGGPHKKDFDWWLIYGPIFLERWMQWKRERQWTVMTMPDGQPGIELGFDITLGGERVIGYIDRVYQSPVTGITVFDLKGLALDTPIPTPSGWTTMGGVKVGDQVFASDGSVCNVTAKSEVKRIGTKVVRFDDTSEIVCDTEHIWWTRTQQGKAPKPRSIGEIERTLRVGKDRQQANHLVPVAGSLNTADAELPIDPYLLGCWLGDGAAGNGVIHKEEALFDILRNDGQRTGVRQHGSTERCSTYTILGLRTKLRAAGLLRNKHVPPAYLRAAPWQRLALLRGMMDTDGTYNRPRKRVSFCSVDPKLADAVYELATSLGERVHKYAYDMTGFGKTVEAHYVEWSATQFNPFRLARKANLVTLRKHSVARRRAIVQVEPGPDVETACIAVDSPNHTYLCGEGMIPTHNTGKMPTSYLQLKTYGLGLSRGYGVEADWGMYWSPAGADSGKLSSPVDLRSYPDERVEDMYAKTMRGIEAGIFLPSISNMCGTCSVHDHCWAVGGSKAGELPMLPDVVKYGTGEVVSPSVETQVQQTAANNAT